MVEVFKTNIDNQHTADELVNRIHRHFDSYRANFDLDDCDRILRVESMNEEVCASAIIKLMAAHNCMAEVLEEQTAL